ncbi:MAG: DNA-3-methyladenine glycosylase [Solirubrobacteraceae bacterium]|nr:DNA-3-methyladenine glycosylase [Solirubrobacteraceae bacterium]
MTHPRAPTPVELRVEVTPPWPFRLRGGSMDGLFRRRGGAVQRLVHVGEDKVFVGALQPAEDRVILAARAAGAAAAVDGLRRMRFAIGVDEDHRAFHEQFRGDRFIGRALRDVPHLRVRRRPDPWEALFCAITEQLIEFERACAIQRRMTAAFGRRCADTGLRDVAPAAVIAAQAPARLAAFDLPQHRASTLRRAAIEVARGRVDLADPDHERGWRRLRAIPGIGPWTTEMLGLMGQGRDDQVAAGDLGYIKLVGRITTGHPKARADVEEVRGFFERYGAFKGLAGEYLRLSAARGWLPA